MTGLVFAILFGLNFLLFPSCEGKISLTVEEDIIVVLPGEDVGIAWKISGIKISDLSIRQWFFLPEDTLLAQIIGDGAVVIRNTNFASRIEIKKPSTLVLKNVDNNFNGTYQLFLSVGSNQSKSDVSVFVADAPNVTFSCSSPIIVNEGDDFTCVCRGEGGNPPANVTWSKNGVQIGEIETEKQTIQKQTLTLSNVDRTDSGTYKCVAKSHINAMFKDEKSIKVEINFKPNETAIRLTPERSVIGESVNITCESNGFPEPSYSIIHNNTEVSTEKMYTISKVNWSDAGTYQCTTENKLGRNSKCSCLTVVGETAASKKVDCESSAKTVVVWQIVATLMSGIIIGILLSYIVWCSRHRWFRNRKPERNPEVKPTEADTTYQELDLTKMNTEDNYQSLRLNAASNEVRNEDDSTYTALSKTRDVEDNYQSLT